MKRAVLSGLFIVLMCSMALAGNSTDISFDVEKIQAVRMNVGDEVRFNLFGEEHIVYLEDVSLNPVAIKFRFVPFKSNNTNAYPGYASLDAISTLDLQKDGVNDLRIALYSADENGAIVMFQAITEGNTITGNAGVVDEGISNKTIYLVIIGVIIIVLIGILIFKNAFDKEEKIEEQSPLEKDIKEEPEEEERNF